METLVKYYKDKSVGKQSHAWISQKCQIAIKVSKLLETFIAIVCVAGPWWTSDTHSTGQQWLGAHSLHSMGSESKDPWHR